MLYCVGYNIMFLYGKRVKETVTKDIRYMEKDDKGRRYKENN